MTWFSKNRDIARLEKDLDEVFHRLRKSEQQDTESVGIMNNLQTMMQNLTEVYNSRESIDVKKFDALSSEIRKVNEKLGTISTQENVLSQKMGNLEKTINSKEIQMKSDIKDTSTVANSAEEGVNELKRTLSRWSGGIAAVLTIGGFVWLVYSEMKVDKEKLVTEIKQERLEMKADKDKLKKELYETHRYQLMNYGELKNMRKDRNNE